MQPGIQLFQTIAVLPDEPPLGQGFHLEITFAEERDRPDRQGGIGIMQAEILLDQQEGSFHLVDAIVLRVVQGRLEDIGEVLRVQEHRVALAGAVGAIGFQVDSAGGAFQHALSDLINYQQNGKPAFVMTAGLLIYFSVSTLRNTSSAFGIHVGAAARIAVVSSKFISSPARGISTRPPASCTIRLPAA